MYRLGFFATGLLVSNVCFSSNANLDETISFLKNKLTTDYYNDSRSFRTFRTFEHNGKCNFTYTADNHSYVSGMTSYISRDLFNARDLNPNKISTKDEERNNYAGEYGVSVSTAENKDKVLTKYLNKDNNREDPVRSTNGVQFFQILKPSSENAPRVANALKHLITLCGGKDELF
jgi:hypothetical protein